MGKQKINELLNCLFAEITVGVVLYESVLPMSVSEIKRVSLCNKYSTEYIEQIIKNLIAYGLVFPHLEGGFFSKFTITEFGRYYYNKLSEQNSDICELMKQIGDDLN